MPSGTRPWSRWNARTVASVSGPKVPSTVRPSFVCNFDKIDFYPQIYTDAYSNLCNLWIKGGRVGHAPVVARFSIFAHVSRRPIVRLNTNWSSELRSTQ